MQPTIDLIPAKEHTDVLDLLCNDLLSTFLSLGINLFKFKDIYLYTHVCLCACLYICMRMCRAEGSLIGYQLRLRKTTLTTLKHMCSLTFWMVSLQPAAAPSVPAREVTRGVLSPLVPLLCPCTVAFCHVCLARKVLFARAARRSRAKLRGCTGVVAHFCGGFSSSPAVV